jgi:cytochrome c oxidase subunit I+III
MTNSDLLELPNSVPRPPGELETLERIWSTPTGFRRLTAINNNIIGVYYIATALLFFVFAGVLAAIMRAQLAVPENTLVSPEVYNQLMTMHGTVMMFLFAVPAVEAAGVLLLPQMLGARDLPFPRLSAYAFWAYAIGGTIFCSSLLFGLAPSGGWFMYPPLTSSRFSSGVGADFWLLGIGFIEISAIAGAIEIIIGVLRTRAPGMTIGKMPVFAWTMLIFAGMVVFAFPAIILATLLLELERAFGWPFFVSDRGGDPLLWQHLFWFFGHPEVYVIFLPAAGMVSMILPSMTQSPLIAYNIIVVALIATGFFSFGLWVHHMFTTGLPGLSLGFFSAASMAVSLPSGVQVFAWIATIANGKLRFHTPALFVLGFLFIFTLGGLTGVMVAMVPFDWQAHDTYFVVAHLHYVLIGGMVFPLFAAIYYWTPAFSRNALDERLGKVAFWLMFIGFNLAFFIMHLTGLWGMPRRVYTYKSEMGWGLPNLVSTIGAYIFAAGVAIVLFDLIRKFRIGYPRGNVWSAGTLEWLPNGNYSARSVPIVRHHNPLWSDSALSRHVEEGRYYLPGTATGYRETIVTSPVEAVPQYVMIMPQPSWSPIIAAAGTAAFFILLTFKLVGLASFAGAVAVIAMIRWGWDLEPKSSYAEVDIGGGIKLPTYMSGPRSHSWWAVSILLLAAAALYLSYVFSYLYLWTVALGVWPSAADISYGSFATSSAGLFIVSSVGMFLASHTLRTADRSRQWTFPALVIGSLAALSVGLILEVYGHWSAGMRPTINSFAALTYTGSLLQGMLVAPALVIGVYSLARYARGDMDSNRRAAFDVTHLLFQAAVAEGLFNQLLVFGFPHVIR